MKAFLLVAVLALPAPVALAESAAPAAKDANAPYHDPCDCIRGTIIHDKAAAQSGVVRPGDGVQDPYGARDILPAPKPEKSDRPLGTG